MKQKPIPEGTRKRIPLPHIREPIIDGEIDLEEEEEDFTKPRGRTLARTKRLLLAALRVWELKNQIRPYSEVRGPTRAVSS